MKNNSLQSMRTVYASLIMGVVVFGMVAIFVLGKPAQPQNEIGVMGYIAIILAILLPAGGMFLYNKKIAEVKDAEAKTKLNAWKSALLIRVAMIEGPCLFCLVNVILSGEDIFIYLYAALLVLMVFNFPTKMRVMSDLQISEEEINKL